MKCLSSPVIFVSILITTLAAVSVVCSVRANQLNINGIPRMEVLKEHWTVFLPPLPATFLGLGVLLWTLKKQFAFARQMPQIRRNSSIYVVLFLLAGFAATSHAEIMSGTTELAPGSGIILANDGIDAATTDRPARADLWFNGLQICPNSAGAAGGIVLLPSVTDIGDVTSTTGLVFNRTCEDLSAGGVYAFNVCKDRPDCQYGVFQVAESWKMFGNVELSWVFQTDGTPGFVEPTLTPTKMPAPTELPTATPTVTLIPTEVPTDVPEDTPTDTPMLTSTNTPTDTLTDTPTDTPEDTPTATPTATHTHLQVLIVYF